MTLDVLHNMTETLFKREKKIQKVNSPFLPKRCISISFRKREISVQNIEEQDMSLCIHHDIRVFLFKYKN